FGPWLLKLFGRSFSEGNPVLLVLILSTIPEALAAATYQTVLSQAKMWATLFTISMPRDGVIVLMAYLLSSPYGAVGLAWAYTLGWVLALLAIITIIVQLGLLDISGRERSR